MKAPITLYLIVISIGLNAQTIIVNPDGTHSILIDNGSIKTLVNPNGTHSTIIDNGSTKTIVNPNGTHSVVVGNGTIKTLVNPNGIHSTIIDNGGIKTIINPNGTYSTVIDNSNINTMLNPDRTHSIIIDNGNIKAIANSNDMRSTVIGKAAFSQNDFIRGKQFSLIGKITKKIQLAPACGFIAFGTVVEFEVIDITGMDYVNKSIGIIITCPEMYGADFFKKGKKYQVVFSNENQTDIGWAIPNKHLLKTNHLMFEPYAITIKKLQ